MVFRSLCLRVLAWMLGSSLIGLGSPILADRPQTLEDCDGLVRNAPDEMDSYACYGRVAYADGRADEAVGRLEGYLAVDSDNQLARIALAYLESIRGGERAVTLYREAADALAEQGPSVLEARTRNFLSNLLARKGLDEEADAELARAREVSQSVGDTETITTIALQQARRHNERGDYVATEQLLRALEPGLAEVGPRLRADWAAVLGYSYWAQGRFQPALELYREQAEIYRDLDEGYAEAGARYNVWLLSHLSDFDDSDEALRTRIDQLEELLELARAAGNRGVQASCHLSIAEAAEELGWDATVVRQHLYQVLDLSPGIDERLAALRFLGSSLIVQEPRDKNAGIRLLAECEEEAHASGRPLQLARTADVTAYVRRKLAFESGWDPALRDTAVQASLTALERIEALRDQQPDHLPRARVFSRWTDAYADIVGSLLHPPEQSPLVENVELAFHVLERKRARILLDELDTALVSSGPAADLPETAERTAVLERLSDVRRELTANGLAAAARVELLARQAALEDRESALRASLARLDAGFADVRAPEIPSLAVVSNRLRPDEAILSYSVGQQPRHRVYSRSWLMLHTSDTTRVFVIPDARILEDAVDLFVALVHNRDGSEIPGAVRLHRELIEPALRVLPAAVDHLILVPEGPLHRLPFALLRPGPDAAMLGTDFQISTVPSITAWLRWREGAELAAVGQTLALADPDLSGLGADREAGGSLERDAVLSQVRQLAPLPHARREVRSLRNHVGDVRSLVGREATERSLKELAVRGIGILHVGAHAVVDYEHPERSAILLAPGAPDEDGLLQTREVVELELGPSVVVLSACRSASGEVLSGEGPMSLARGFFVAGARTVIGSLWPLRDDEAAALFDDFYRHLAGGESLAGALNSARRDRIAAGAPAAAWAGVVLLGDGSPVPFPGGVRDRWLSRNVLYVLLAAASLSITAGLIFCALRRRNESA